MLDKLAVSFPRQSLGDEEVRPTSRVLIHGLKSAQQFNFRAGTVIRLPESGGEASETASSSSSSRPRYAVKLMGEDLARLDPKLMRRENFLRSWLPGDREMFLARWIVEKSLFKFFVPHLLRSLSDNEGLLLHIASFLPCQRMCLYQFGGFMGRLWEEHWRFTLPLGGGEYFKCSNLRRPRLDAATCDVGCGLVLFAGGCGAHPRRCVAPHGFFNTADLYDSLTDEWNCIQPMKTRRHGASACRLGSNAYVVGGVYVDVERPVSTAEKFCEVLDLDSWTWSPIPSSAYTHVEGVPLAECSFFAMGAVSGRIVLMIHEEIMAYNPLRGEWRLVEAEGTALYGSNASSIVFNDELVLASGRDDRYAKKVAAFSFTSSASAEQWWTGGKLRQLPDLLEARMGGSLSIMGGQLHMTGGVCERSSEFSDTAECLQGDAWVTVPDYRMPRAVHAHTTFVLPCLYSGGVCT